MGIDRLVDIRDLKRFSVENIVEFHRQCWVILRDS